MLQRYPEHIVGNRRIRGFIHHAHRLLVQQGEAKSREEFLSTDGEVELKVPNKVEFDCIINENLRLAITQEGLFVFDFLPSWIEEKTERVSYDKNKEVPLPNYLSFAITQYFNLFMNILYRVHSFIGHQPTQSYASPTNVLTPILTESSHSVWPETNWVPALWRRGSSGEIVPLPLSGHRAWRQVLTTGTVNVAVGIFRRYMDDTLIRLQADSISLSRDLAQQYECAQGIIVNWLVIEQCIYRIWKKMVETELKGKDVGGLTTGGRRRKFLLKDDRSFTASVKTEVLNILGLIPDTLYDQINDIRSVRNKIVHGDRKYASLFEYAASDMTASRMVNLSCGEEIFGPSVLNLGWQFDSTTASASSPSA